MAVNLKKAQEAHQFQEHQPVSSGRWLALPSSIYLFAFFIVPLFLVLMMSFLTRGENASSYVFPVTTQNYARTLGDPHWLTLVDTIRIAVLTTVICLIIGYPLAFFISTRQRAWVRHFSIFMVILPFWTNFLVRTYAWQIILGRLGPLNELLIELGIIDMRNRLEILGTETAILIGLVYGFLPFMVLPIYASVERFNFRLVEAAHDLGASDWRVFWRVVLPMTMPGVVAGCILVFVPAIGAYVTPVLLGGTKGFMVGNLIDQLFFKSSGGSWPLGSAVSIVTMVIVSFGLIVYSRYAGEESYQRSQSSIFNRAWQQVIGLIGRVIAVLYRPFRSSQPRTRDFAVSRFQMQRDLLVRRVGRVLLWVDTVACYIFLWIPIVLLVAYSFNDSRRAGGRWEGFSTRWYEKLFEGVSGSGSQFSTDQLLESLQITLTVSIIATVIATILGTMIAMSLVRGRFKGKWFIDLMIYIAVVIPDITMGVSLLVSFTILFDLVEAITGNRPFPGIVTVIMAHVAFNIAFVAIVVRARLADMNPHLEEAARDLGANEWRTFRRITYPLLLPGIVAGALLAFTLSLDDFVVTFFTSGGSTTTLTVFVWGLVRRGVSPEINAVSTLMILVSTLLITVSLLLQGRNATQA